MFEQEMCWHCKKLGILVVNPENGLYRWRCPQGGLSWVTEGSVMGVANEIIYADLDKE